MVLRFICRRTGRLKYGLNVGGGINMRIPKILFMVGVVLLVVGIAVTVIPATVERWEHKEEKLVHEIATVPPLFDYFPLALKYIPEGSTNIKVAGTVKEVKNRQFDFYVFNKQNYDRWMAKITYEAYVEAKQVTSYSFSFSPTRGEVIEGLYLVVSNVYATEPKEEEWSTGTIIVYSFMDHYVLLAPMPLLPEGSTDIVIKGDAREAHGYKFNFYIFDTKNYDLWKTGRPYEALYEGKGEDSYSYQFTIKPEQTKETFLLVAERVTPDVQLNVDVLSYISWLQPTSISVEYDVSISWEEKTYTHVLGGLVLGGGLAGLGVLVMIVAAIAKYVFKK